MKMKCKSRARYGQLLELYYKCLPYCGIGHTKDYNNMGGIARHT